MNRLLAIVLDTEEKAGATMRELRHLDRKGDITLNALTSVSKDADGHVNAMHTADVPGIDGAGAGLAADRPVGGRGHIASLGEASASRGSLHDTHDFWVAGMGLHFVEETLKFLKPGQVAVLTDVKEE